MTGTRRRAALLVVAGLCSAQVALVGPAAEAAPTWLPQIHLSTGTVPESFTPQVVTDRFGNTTAAWHATADDALGAFVAVHPAGGTWAEPVRVSDPARDAYFPTLDVDAQGTVTVVWSAVAEGGGFDVESASRPLSGDWSAAVPLGESNLGVPDVAVDDAGNAVAVWEEDAGSTILWASGRAPGGAWTTPVQLTPGGQSAQSPVVAMDRSSGVATAAWQRSNGTVILIQARQRVLGGSWSPVVDLSLVGQNAAAPDLATVGGTTTAVWHRSDGVYLRVQTSSLPAGGTWTSPKTLSEEGHEATSPHVAVEADGRTTVVWRQTGTLTHVVYAATRPPGGEWSTAVPLSNDAHHGRAPTVTADPTGGVRTTWLWDTGSQWEVQAAHLEPAGQWTNPAPVGGNATAGTTPAAAVDPDGDTVVVWMAGAAKDFVEARALDVAGPVVTMTVPATAVALTRKAFRATATDSWALTATYSWSFGDGKTASGPSVAHKYAKAGKYVVRVTVTDTVGNSTARESTVKVRARPVISVLRLATGTIHTGGRTALTVKLNTKATLTLVFKGKTTGTKAVLGRKLPKGISTLIITTSVSGKRLKPDTYVLTAKATDSTGTSPSKKVTLKVVR